MKTNATIFLVDDDADDREIFAFALAEALPSCACVTANNGLEALLRLKGDGLRPDCIFLDLNMPRMNGRQCLESIKQEAGLSDIPVVIYTTSSEPRDEEQMLALGAAAFVTKPPRIDDLITSLQHVFVHLP